MVALVVFMAKYFVRILQSCTLSSTFPSLVRPLLVTVVSSLAPLVLVLFLFFNVHLLNHHEASSALLLPPSSPFSLWSLSLLPYLFYVPNYPQHRSFLVFSNGS